MYDGTHPVAGNRRFGIIPHTKKNYEFYIMGVDRMWDRAALIPLLNLDRLGFSTADELWSKIQENMITYIDSKDGNASLFSNAN